MRPIFPKDQVISSRACTFEEQEVSMNLKDHPQASASIKFRRCAGEAASPCTVCGSSAKSDFNVPADIWKMVVPTKYWNRVVCVKCFGNFACEKQIELLRLLSLLLPSIWSCGGHTERKYLSPDSSLSDGAPCVMGLGQ
jgi:hypothetical protein